MAFDHPQYVARAAAFSPAHTTAQPHTNEGTLLLVVANRADIDAYPKGPYARIAAHNAAHALQTMNQSRPQVVVIDWDVEAFDPPRLCATLAAHSAVLITTARPENAPAALRAGCHSILLKPLTPSLTAGRIGRLAREVSARPAVFAGTVPLLGTNRRWEDSICPHCGIAGTTSFEFSSHRRAWFACLTCDNVWLGRRRE